MAANMQSHLQKQKRRTERRNKFDAFTHPTFDPALFYECMSSEESCDEETQAPHSPSGTSELIQIRGLPWRSTRLRNFYDELDREDDPEVLLVDGVLINKPRRTVPRKERCLGPPKEASHMPPKDVASWMVSRRWIREQLQARPDLEASLRELIANYPGFDWANFHALGEESDEEYEQVVPESHYIPQSNTSYSLAHALVPM